MPDTTVRDEAKEYLNKPGPVSVSFTGITYPAILNFLECVEDGNPIYWDEETAKGSRFGRIIAPPQALMTLGQGRWWTPEFVRQQQAQKAQEEGVSPQQQAMAIINKHGYTVATNVTREDEFLDTFGPGDGRLKSQTYVSDISEEKRTRVGKGVFITTIIEYRTEKDDRLVARTRNVLLMYNPAEPRGD